MVKLFIFVFMLDLYEMAYPRSLESFISMSIYKNIIKSSVHEFMELCWSVATYRHILHKLKFLCV